MFTHWCTILQLTDIVQYNYIPVSNVVLIDKVYRNNIIIIPGELSQLNFYKSHFGHNNSTFHTLSQHKMNLIYVNILFAHKLKKRDCIQVLFGSQVENYKIYKNIEKLFDYAIVTLLIISTYKHDQNFYIKFLCNTTSDKNRIVSIFME